MAALRPVRAARPRRQDAVFRNQTAYSDKIAKSADTPPARGKIFVTIPLLPRFSLPSGKVPSLTWKCCSPSNPGTPQNCLRRFCGEPHSGFPPPLGKICGEPHSGFPPPLGKSSVLYHGSIDYPPSFGFPPKSFPLKRGPTISGDTFGARAQGRPRTAPPRRRHVMPLAMRPLREKNGALLAHVSSALGTHTVAAALKRRQAACERLVGGSTSN